MAKLLLCMLVMLMVSPALEAGDVKPFEIPRTDTVGLNHTELDRQYELFIRLPEDYDKNTDTNYPVIYTTDAVWHMDLLSGVTNFAMPNVIIVGISWQKNMSEAIDYGHRRPFASRFRDYSFTPSDRPEIQEKYQFGQADKHLSFIRNHVKKYVSENYRVDKDNETYLGYSMGGEFGAYILLAQPDTFDNYILGSPSVEPTSIEFLDALEKQNASQKTSHKANVFLSIGELENSVMDAIKQLESILKRRAQNGISLKGLDVIEDSDHSTAVPDTFTRSIRWLSTLNSKQVL